MRLAILTLVLAAVGCAQCPTSYGYQRNITVQNGQVSGTLSSFPMLVLNPSASLKTVGNGGHVQNSNGYDVIFVNGSGTTLPFELVGHGTASSTYVATSGNAEFWVNVASITDGTAIYMCYGNASVSSYQGNDGATWTSYVSVWHMQGMSSPIVDSTGANNCTPVNGPTTAAGQISLSASLSTASAQGMTCGTSTTLSPAATTIEAWVKGTSFPNAYNAVYSRSNSSRYTQVFVKSTGKLAVYFNGGSESSYDPGVYGATGSNTLSTGTLYHLAVAYDSTNGLHSYVNGAPDATVAAAGALAPISLTAGVGEDVMNSGRTWNGLIDEVRVSSDAKTAGWVLTEYKNQSAPGNFYSVGAEVSQPTSTFAVSPTAVPVGQPNPVVVSLVGNGTSWTSSSRFAVSGIGGVSCAASPCVPAVTDATHATITLTAIGANAGPLTITESVTGTAVATLAMGLGGGQFGIVGGQ